MPYPHKNIRLPRPYYVGQSSSFITVCCEDRRPIFTDAARAAWLVEELRKYSGMHNFVVHAYCVMPDHLHVFVSGMADTSDLFRFVKTMKQMTGHTYSQETGQMLWQKKFYDHILRETDNGIGVAGYIWMNPVRAGLCADARDYPFSGSFTMDWKKAVTPVESWIPSWKRNAETT